MITAWSMGCPTLNVRPKVDRAITAKLAKSCRLW